MDDELYIGFGAPGRQSRFTVAFRALLAIPHLVLLLILSVCAIPLVIVGWFAALILGRLPRGIATYVTSLIAYSVRVNAYWLMLAREFPAFAFSVAADYPVTVKIEAARLSRLKVLFRWLLMIPVVFVSGLVFNGLLVLSPIIWLVTLVLGRMPLPFFGAAAAVVRYQARVSAYLYLVTDSYPRRLFGDTESEFAPEGFRLSLSKGAKWVMGLILALGIANSIGGMYLRYERMKPNPAILVARLRLEIVAADAVAVAGCNLRCEKAHAHVLGKEYFRFASSLSRIPFPRSQLAQVVVLINDARQVGQLLLAASKSEDGGRALGIDPADPGDSPLQAAFDAEVASVFGPLQ